MLNAALTKIIKDALAAAKLAAEVNSPSKLFGREVGSPIVEGIEFGILKRMPKLIEVIDGSIKESAAAGNAALALGAGKANNTTPGFGSAISENSNALQSLRERSAWQTIVANEAANTPPVSAPVDARQYITFESTMQAPDEVARAIRRTNTFGLAGSRK